ncbi:hypothetical protein GF359_08205 [candidate division WOR-3 bacterium]|uniref:Uncharacterized protein n=1 Tax=candidate division WOR-3 bacterium TaxID=2052148 RepID=A0A9D5KA75_UNCW3|nr:hypothetical protein [candidate division WOR-3 bacterium]MBD3365183.1 hypothetical protein [candidate division WOR-3 bacterium]
MAQPTITGDNIVASLKILGFVESDMQSKSENKVSLSNGEHKIIITKGWLENVEANRMYQELLPIFEAFENQVQASDDRNLHKVRDWLEARTAKIRNR